MTVFSTTSLIRSLVMILYSAEWEEAGDTADIRPVEPSTVEDSSRELRSRNLLRFRFDIDTVYQRSIVFASFYQSFFR